MNQKKTKISQYSLISTFIYTYTYNSLPNENPASKFEERKNGKRNFM